MLKSYNLLYNLFDKVVFFGIYHWGDYLRLLVHFGKKNIFWCGSDILNLQQSVFCFILPLIKAKHFCENEVEQKALEKIKIKAKICPMIFDSEEIKVNFKPSKTPDVYLTVHPGSERAYGIDKLEQFADLFPNITFHVYGLSKPFHEVWYDHVAGRIHNIDYASRYNIIYHGHVPELVFNEEIKDYQAALRLNKFDGFAETLAKSALMGQYPISWIHYPHITRADNARSLRFALEALSKKKEPNYDARKYWLKKLNESLCIVLS